MRATSTWAVRIVPRPIPRRTGLRSSHRRIHLAVRVDISDVLTGSTPIFRSSPAHGPKRLPASHPNLQVDTVAEAVKFPLDVELLEVPVGRTWRLMDRRLSRFIDEEPPAPVVDLGPGLWHSPGCSLRDSRTLSLLTSRVDAQSATGSAVHWPMTSPPRSPVRPPAPSPGPSGQRLAHSPVIPGLARSRRVATSS